VEMTNFSKINKLIPHYQGKMIEKFIYRIPRMIGIKKIDAVYEVNWNDKESQIEGWLSIKNDSKILIGQENFKLEKDERILTMRSVKFNEWTFTKLLSDVGFRTELLATSKDRSYVLSMVQPTRYCV
jgi:hypothetical protein